MRIPHHLQRWIDKWIYRLYAGAIVLGISFVIFIIGLIYASRPPHAFPIASVVEIPPNATVSEIADKLSQFDLIKSPLLFKIVIKLDNILTTGGMGAVAGDYLFSLPDNVFSIAHRIAHGYQGLARIRVTFPEGITVKDMAEILADKIPDFDAKGFVEKALPQEGYLYPDTYFFFENAKPEDVINTMHLEFEQKVATIDNEIEDYMARSHRSLADIITMASIVEKEANDDTTRALIAGVLWKRIDKGMLLQADPTLTYAHGRSSLNLTVDDLNSDSLYNTYKIKGLPKGPISNPSLSSITATVTPTDSPYWFYLSDKKMVTHFAKTFEEHTVNKAKYIR